MSTKIPTSYFDICIRLFLSGEIRNFHILAIPMFSRHSGGEIYLHADKSMNFICLNWKDTIVLISMDCERKMTGRVQVVATRFKKSAKPVLFSLWCGLHQLDLLLQELFKKLMDKEFFFLLTGIIY